MSAHYRYISTLPTRPLNTIRSVLLLLCLPSSLWCAEWKVQNQDELVEAMTNASPGDIIWMAPGNWVNLEADLHFAGEKGQPVIVRAREPGRTLISGNTRIRMTGSHGQLEGLSFHEARAVEGASALIDIGSRETSAKHLRITNCSFRFCNPGDPATRYAWIRLRGRHHRIDHNEFAGQNHSGVTVQVRVDEASPEHRIDHNLFRDRAPGEGNGFEMIQIGQSTDSMKRGGCRVEDNWFVECDGETEIISSKTNENLIRRNFFDRCSGTVTLRHGKNSVVENNTFRGEGKPGSGGIRVVDSGHRIAHNTFSGLTGRTGGVIVLYTGIPDSPLNGYFPAHHAVIRNNRFEANTGNGIYLNGGYGNKGRVLLPTNGVIEGNVWISQSGGSVAVAGTGIGFSYSDNHYFSGVETGVVESAGLGLTESGPVPSTAGPQATCPPRSGTGPSWSSNR